MGEFVGVGVGRAVGLVVEVVEFADGGDAGQEHFEEGERGGGADLFGGKAEGGVVHLLAPGPEVVVLGLAVGGAVFGAAADGALEGVAMGVDHAGDEGDVAKVGNLHGGGLGQVSGGVDGEDFAVLDVEGAVFEHVEVVEDVAGVKALDGRGVRHDRYLFAGMGWGGVGSGSEDADNNKAERIC